MNATALMHAVPEGAYAERMERRPSTPDRIGAAAAAPVLRRVHAWRRRWLSVPRLVEKAAPRPDASDAALREQVEAVRLELRRTGFDDAVVARSFGLVREVAHRAVGQRPFDVQLIGARVLLAGRVAEMETGEGKTLTATLAAATAALAGVPVHVVTVNDYLAARDAEMMGPVYDALGLTVGPSFTGMPTRSGGPPMLRRHLRHQQRVGVRLTCAIGWRWGAARAACDLQLERLAGRGAQSSGSSCAACTSRSSTRPTACLIDEARTPLIISGATDQPTERRVRRPRRSHGQQLVKPSKRFQVDRGDRQVRAHRCRPARSRSVRGRLGGVWRGARAARSSCGRRSRRCTCSTATSTTSSSTARCRSSTSSLAA